jgi:hypothetical protein
MAKRLMFFIALFGLVFITGCAFFTVNTPQPGISDAELATLIANGTQQAILAQPTTPPTETPLPVVEPTATATTSPGSIVISSIVESGPGRAIISWDPIGDFPSGFKVVWTDVQGLPTFPENNSVYTSDPYARSSMISGVVGKIYYVRVCRFTGDKCDIYSNLGIFAFTRTALTPLPTITARPADATATKLAMLTPKATYISGGSGSGSIAPAITIIEMKGGEDGKAFIKWTSSYKPSAGFKIVYSPTSTTPIYGNDFYFYISDGTVRQAWVDGVPGTKYYYRICGYNGTKCEVYSPVFTYTFAGTVPTPTPAFTATPDPAVINITGITDFAPGQVTVNWDATGTFPSGFKVLFSKTNPLPTLSDAYVYVSDGTLRTALVAVEPGQLVYYRVCKYNGSNCVVYSPAMSFTAAAAAVETGFTLTAGSMVAGSVELNWAITSDSPNGYKILWDNATPVPNNAYKGYVSDPTIHTFTDAAMLPGTVYAKICRWSGSWCLSYSNTLSIAVTP